MKARLLRDSEMHVGTDAANLPIFRPVPRGTVVDHPDAHLLVKAGAAMPADDECAQRCAMTAEAMAAAERRWERANKGIAAEDYAAFDAGEMVGYNPDGTPIPGPHAVCE